jgi:fructose-specific component phosphotransferase system IIB-like protein
MTNVCKADYYKCVLMHCSTTLGASTMWLFAGLLLPVYACWKLIQLARADADLALLGKGKYKPDAFEGKKVWVVGASQGLGESVATELSSLGARVILSSRRKDALQVPGWRGTRVVSCIMY